mgnify:CR=1 FL=1
MRALEQLRLQAFRSYPELTLSLPPRPVWFAGPNGAGKTNILEAMSLLGPGRGLRRAKLPDCARKPEADSVAEPWTVAGRLRLDAEVYELGGRLTEAGRREVRLDGQTVGPTRLASLLPLVWLTPQHDRLFVEGASERRRFFDRLVLSDVPTHGKAVQAYEAAMRQRTRLLQEGQGDEAWLAGLERSMAEQGVQVAQARHQTLMRLQTDIDTRPDGAFPKARLRLLGEVEAAIAAHEPPEAVQEQTQARLRQGRYRDAAAGRALEGVHRSDLEVIHAPSSRPAAECSTGEQKALLIGLVLARVRTAQDEFNLKPLVLLDEACAHLDAARRGALADEICDLEAQVFMTGVEANLFSDFADRAQGFLVKPGQIEAQEGVK